MESLTLHASLIDGIEVPIFILGIDKNETVRFMKMNLYHEQITGIKSEKVEGLTPHEAFPKRLADTVTENYMACVRSKRMHSYEELLTLPAGEMWVNTTLAPVVKKNRVIGVLGMITNISAQKTTEQRFISALSELRQVNTDLQVLISTTAHDLRGPLRQAKLINDLILETQSHRDDDLVELLELEGDVLNKALEQIDNSLQMMSSPRETTETRSTINLGVWCRGVIGVLDPFSILNFSAPDIVIECEKFVLDIALRNILDNALKYAVSKVSVAVQSDADGLIFTVYDDGPGFDMTQNKLNEPPVLSDQGDGGNGFGLASAINLIEQRNGRVWLSEPHREHGGGAVSFFIDGRQVEEQEEPDQEVQRVA